MPATYEPIATTTLGSAAATITFSSIPATYTDLRVTFNFLVATGAQIPKVTYNNDSSALYSDTFIYGTGTSALSARDTGGTFFYAGSNTSASTTVPEFITLDIFSYAGSTNKTTLYTSVSDKNGSGAVEYGVALYRSTSAINRIDFTSFSGTFAIGSIATIYGIKNA
jgi:hypothetical protein